MKKKLTEFIYKTKVNKNLNKTQKIKKSLEIFHKFFISYQKQILKYEPSFPILNITNYEKKESKDKLRFFIFVTTRPYNNHPFSIFGEYNEKEINIMIPLGNNTGQIEFKD